MLMALKLSLAHVATALRSLLSFQRYLLALCLSPTSKPLNGPLIENSQRVDVHPYEEAEGFQRLLDLPGYDVASLAEKTGKSESLVYARLALLQLIPEVAEAFQQERITGSHANLIARLPQDRQKDAFDHCWRKDWQE